MPTNKRLEKRKSSVKFPIEFLNCAVDETSSSDGMLSTTVLNVGEEATFSYDGKSININIDSLNQIRVLGHGRFGYVILTEIKDCPGLQIAVKKLNLHASTNNSNDFTAETDLQTLRKIGEGVNPHVTKYYTAFVDKAKQQLLICMEACETSMENFYTTMYMIKETQHLDLLLKRLIRDIVDALHFLKSKDILHRDVKPSNILINQNPIIFKLCDFGICGHLINAVARTMMKGTQIYLAPERIDRTLAPHGYGIQSDMWALGLSTLEIATNDHPFREMKAADILNKVQTWTPELSSNLSIELQQLIIWLLKVQQEDRPKTYDDILLSNAVQSLPLEITNEEAETVKNVIERIPPISEN